jgi:hypothetical protein
MANSEADHNAPQQVVFIDSNVPDIADLLGGLQPGEVAFVIDPGSDGVQQIANIIAANNLTNLSSISIVGHGAAGAIDLGSAVLNDGDLSGHASALAQIGAALAPGGDLQLFACSVASGTAGQQFIADLSSYVGGAPVAASTQDIGQTATGENWTLDAISAPVADPSGSGVAAAPISRASLTAAATAVSEVSNPFTADAEAQFSGTLAVPTTELWIAATGGGDQNLIIHSDNTGTGTASNVGTLFTPTSANNPSDVNLNDQIAGIDLLQLDTQDGLYFIATQNNDISTAPGQILEGSLKNALANPTATPTYTTLFSTFAPGEITGIAVDPDNAELYFEFGHNFEKVSYSGGTPTVLGSPSDGSFLDGVALDLPHHVAYFLSGTSNTTTTTTKNGLPDRSDPNGNIHYITVFTGSIYETSTLTAASGANSVTISKLVTIPNADGAPANGETVGIAVDTVTGRLFFTTKTVVGVGAAEGGVFWIDPTDPTHTIHTVFRQSSSGTGILNTGTLLSIDVDDATGKYYVSVLGVHGEGGAVYVGNLTDSGVQPTLFETMPTFNTGGIEPAPQGFSIDNAPTLSITPTNPTFTESTLNPASSNNTPVGLVSAVSAGDTDNDKLVSATVSVGSFFAGDTLTFSNNHSITGSYNTSTGVLTFSGEDTLADYQAALASVKFTSTSDNPTNFGADNSRTLSFTVNDGLLSSAPVSETVTVVGTNDPPVNHLPGATPTGNEDQQFNITGLSVSDVDADPASQAIIVAITVTHGTLNVLTNVAGGLVAAGVVGNNSATVTLTGTQNAINATLAANGLRYLGNANYNGPDTVTVTTNDQGDTGSGGAQQVTNQFNITINPVNDPPAGTNNTTTILEDHPYTFAAADFGFSDPIDAANGVHGADSFQAVKITTLPTAGTLTDNGVTVTVGQFVSVADITANKLVFAPAANANGTNYSNFTFQVQDNGGTANGGIDTDASPNTFTFNVTPVNDPPAGTNKTVTINEDGTFTFAVADFGFSDPNDTPANSLKAVEITTLPGAGLLTDNGVAVGVGQFVAVADINANKLVFAPAANANGANYANFTFQVQDDGGTANGGIDTDASPNTFTVNVNSVNDAPSGTDKTITTNEDTAYTFAMADFGFTDPNDTPPNGFAAVEITTLASAGTLKDSGVAVTAGQLVAVADITGGKLVFTPAANANGTDYASFTFQVQDNGGTANGGVNTDPTPNTVTFNVTSVNDAPAGADKTVTINEDGSYTFATADFGFSDPNDTPANTFAAVEITTLPAAGALTDSGHAVTAGEAILVADIAGGELVFTPAANGNGAPYASFTFQVEDNGGTANGGVDTDASPNTFTVDVNSVNDAPLGADNTKTINEDTPYTFAAADFGFTDPNDTPANLLAAVEITTLQTAGTLTDNGVAVTTGQLVSAADITGGKLVFTPAANANGTDYASFTFQVEDNGGTANGGVNLAASANTFTFNVTSVNDAPAGTNATISVNATLGDFTLTAADFGFTDPNDTPPNGFLAVEITTLPTDGTLKLNGTAVAAHDVIQKTDIDANDLTFTANAGFSGLDSGLTFQVQDNGGTANGGVDLDPTPNTLTLNIKIANQAPVGTNEAIAVHQDTPYHFVAADFGFTDPNDTPPNNLLAVEITTLPSDGALTDNGVAVTATQFVSVTDINAGSLVYTPNSPDPTGPFDTFTFQVEDDGGTANGGIDTDPSPKTLSVDIVGANLAPSGADKTQTILEDQSYTFAAGDFGFSDADTPADHFQAVEITTLPSGTLTDGVNAVTTGQFIPVADINAGLLVFTPTLNANGTPQTSFTFQVQDDGGTAGGGVDTDPSANTFTFDVTPVNDAPAGTNNTVTTLEDTSHTFAAADFGFTDPDDTPANALLAVEITTLPGAGALTDNSVTVTAGQLVSVADIDTGLLVFAPAPNANGAAYASLTFQVQDDGGTANGGIDLDPTPNTITLNVTSVNDAPAGTDKTVTTAEDTSYTFATADFGFSDPSDSPANALLAVEITTLPTAGTLSDGGVPVTATEFVPVADIGTGQLIFTPAANANGSGYATFTFQVQDDGGTAGGGIDTDPTPNTVTLDVTSVNDPPSGASNTVTTNEDTSFTFAAADFGFTDPDDTPPNALAAVEITAPPLAGSLTDNGTTVTAGQLVSVADITGGKLVFAPAANANGAAYASFTFQVEDDGGTANGGVNLDPTARTMTLDVTSVNDAPVGTDKTTTILEDHSYTFLATDFGFADPVDAANGGANAFQAVKITSLPSGGTLTDLGGPVTAGQFVAVTDITGGNLVFTPAANANGSPETSFTFQVQDNGGTAHGGIDTDPSAKTFTFDVTPVNDPPSGTANTVTTNEDTPFTFAAADFGFTDPNDNPANTLLAVKITALPGAGLLTDSGAAVTVGQFVPVADITGGHLVFASAPNANGIDYASFTFEVQDNGGTANGGIDTDPSAKTMTVNVTPVNDPPVLADVAPTAAYAPNGAPVDLSPGNLALPLDITDIDSPMLAGATVVISNSTFLGDLLAVNGQSNGIIPGLPDITAVYNPGDATLTLSGLAPVDDYIQALQEVTFQSTNGSPTNGGLNATRTLEWQVNDGSAQNNLSAIEQSTIALHTLDLDGDDSTALGTSFAATFTEHGPPVAVADSDIVINDVDTATMSFATITLTNAAPSDSLAISGSLPAGIVFSVNTSVPGEIIATLNGPASTAAFETALHQVVFNNASGNPAGGQRDLNIFVTDNLGISTNVAQSIITVVPVNDPPTLTGVANVGFTENGAAVALASNATITDPDSPGVADATVHIGGTFTNDGDVLGFSTAGTAITANYDAASETLVLTGVDTRANYAQVLNSLTFFTPSDNPTDFGLAPNRTVTWTLDDGAASNSISTVTTTVNITAVNDPPTLSAVALAVSLPISHTVVISPSLAVSDPDNQTLAGATVAITAGAFAGDGDVLSANTAGTTISAAYNPANETLVLSGSDTLADYTSVLDSVTFLSGPSPGTNRTVTWTLNDGSASNSIATATTTIDVALAKNDFNGDNTSDVTFQDTASAPIISGRNQISGDANSGVATIDFISNGTVTSTATLQPNPTIAWRIVGSGDFNGDGKADILFQNAAGTPMIWTMNASGGVTSEIGLPATGPNWTAIGTGDFNGDGQSDILFQNSAGTPMIWLMNGTSVAATAGLPNTGSNWTAVGTGDFNGDGKSDILFQNTAGVPMIWLMNGTSVTATAGLPDPGADWRLVGTGDFNQDGKSDLVFQNTNGTPMIWTMNGTSVTSQTTLADPGAAWHLVGTGDYNGDGKADLLFQSATDGTAMVWTMNATSVAAQTILPNPGGAALHANTG